MTAFSRLTGHPEQSFYPFGTGPCSPIAGSRVGIDESANAPLPIDGRAGQNDGINDPSA